MAGKADLLKKKVATDRAAEQTKTTTQKKKEVEKMEKVVKGTKAPIPEPKTKKPTKKDTHKTFTTWVEKEQLAQWKAYIATKGIKSEDLALYAIQHYIDNVYPIEAKEKEAYEKNLAKALKNVSKDARKAR